MDTTETAAEARRRPVKQVRIGRILAAIWRQESEEGRPFYNVTVQRLYKLDEPGPEGEEWGYSDSFGRRDLLEVGKVLDHAHTWIVRKEEDDRQAARDSMPGETPF